MQHLTKIELSALLAAAKQPTEAGKRNHLMILVAFWHGLRASEVTGMKGKNIQKGYITIARLKGSMKTTQPLIESGDELFDERDELEQLARKVGPEGLMFPVSRVWFWKVMQKACADAGIPKHKAHPHVLKHTTAMLTIKEAGIEHVRQYLGHKSIASTGEYLKVTDEQASKAIAAAIGGRQ